MTKWTDEDLQTAFEDGCKFTDLKDLKEFLKNRNQNNNIMSVDLDKLAKKVDKALAKETKESITKWLNERRQNAEK